MPHNEMSMCTCKSNLTLSAVEVMTRYHVISILSSGWIPELPETKLFNMHACTFEFITCTCYCKNTEDTQIYIDYTSHSLHRNLYM